MNMWNIVWWNSLEVSETQKKLSLPFDTKEIYSLLGQGNYIWHFGEKYPHLSKNNPYNITEWMIYSQHEQDLYRIYFGEKFTEHDGVDIHLPYGTPIYAPCDMYVMSSYQSTCARSIQKLNKEHITKMNHWWNEVWVFLCNDIDQKLEILSNLVIWVR